MHEFETPEPISAVVEIVVGSVLVEAADRVDTVVEVRPSDSSRPADVSAAEQTRVEYADGRLLVKTPRRWTSYTPFGDDGSIDVAISLPSGSRVTGKAAVATFRSTGSLGDCRLETSMGDLRVDQAAGVRLTTSAGDISLERAAGDAELSTGSGTVHVGEIDGTAVIKNSNGDSRVTEVTGELRVKAANGDIAIGSSRASVTAKTANGDIRVGSAGPGSVVAETGLGDVEIAIPEGPAVWLDLDTRFGRLDNALEATGPPGPGEDTVEVRARSASGDITVRRADGEGQ